MKECPFCAEQIQDAATVCPCCGRETSRFLAVIKAFGELCLSLGQLGCLLMVLIPLGYFSYWFLFSNNDRSASATQPSTSISPQTQAPPSVAPETQEDIPRSTTDSVSSFRIGEMQILANGSWVFADERSYNEWLMASQADDVKKLSDLEKSSRAFKTPRDHPVFIVALDGFAGLVKVRTRKAGYSRWLLWTSPENVKSFAPPDEFHSTEAMLSKNVVIYKKLDVLRSYDQADAADNEEQAMRLGKKLNADLIRLQQETRVKVLERDHDPRFYQVEATLANGSVVHGWARARDLKRVQEDAEQAADSRKSLLEDKGLSPSQ